MPQFANDSLIASLDRIPFHPLLPLPFRSFISDMTASILRAIFLCWTGGTKGLVALVRGIENFDTGSCRWIIANSI